MQSRIEKQKHENTLHLIETRNPQARTAVMNYGSISGKSTHAFWWRRAPISGSSLPSPDWDPTDRTRDLFELLNFTHRTSTHQILTWQSACDCYWDLPNFTQRTCDCYWDLLNFTQTTSTPYRLTSQSAWYIIIERQVVQNWLTHFGQTVHERIITVLSSWDMQLPSDVKPLIYLRYTSLIGLGP